MRSGLHFNFNLFSKYFQTVGPKRTEAESADAGSLVTGCVADVKHSAPGIQSETENKSRSL